MLRGIRKKEITSILGITERRNAHSIWHVFFIASNIQSGRLEWTICCQMYMTISNLYSKLQTQITLPSGKFHMDPLKKIQMQHVQNQMCHMPSFLQKKKKSSVPPVLLALTTGTIVLKSPIFMS